MGLLRFLLPPSPSSLQNSITSGLVLEDFDSVFSNNFYHSHLDNICELSFILKCFSFLIILSLITQLYLFSIFSHSCFGAANINSSAVVAAASLVARTLYILASGDTNISSSTLTAINVNVSLVEELMDCLLGCDPGLSCELVKNYITPSTTCPSYYVGVMLDEPSSTPYLGAVADISRFLWNFLADRTSIPSKNGSSACSQGCSKNEVCIRAEADGKGVCAISTTRYFTCLLVLIHNGQNRACI